jgi:hypothetical protein
MPPLQGLKGLYPDPQDTSDFMDEGVLEAKANAPNTEHGEYGVQHLGYSGTVPDFSPFGPLAVYDGWDRADTEAYGSTDFRVPGEGMDSTPVTHSSPYPRGIIQPDWGNPDAYALVGEQLNQLHGPELGGTVLFLGHAPSGHEESTDYTTDRYDAPNENYLTETPGQIHPSGSASSGGYGAGNADTTQGYGVLNTLPEFQMGHSIRRQQHDHMPWDFTNTHGEQLVPFQGKHPIQQMPLDGPDSPYFEQGAIDGANIPWEGRIGYPTPYVQPEEPTIVAASPSDNADMWAWSG